MNLNLVSDRYVDLDNDELMNVEGGSATVVIALFSLGYAIGKDIAKRG